MYVLLYSNISLTGLSSEVKLVDTSPVSTSFSLVSFYLHVSVGGLSGTYNASGSIHGLPIGGDSVFDIASNSFSIRFSEKFQIDQGFIRLLPNNYFTADSEFFFGGSNLSIIGTFSDMFNTETVQYEQQVLKRISEEMPFWVFGYESPSGTIKLFYNYIYDFLVAKFAVS